MSDDVRDAIEQDMAAHESGRGREVRALENQSLAAQMLEQLDRHKAEAKTVAAASVAAPEFVGEREGNHGVYLLGQAKSDDVRTRAPNAAERWFYEHAMPRLSTLMNAVESGPLGAASWRQRVMSVLSLQADAAGFRAAGLEETARDRERRYMFELVTLLDESDAVFRPSWKADVDDRRIFVTVPR